MPSATRAVLRRLASLWPMAHRFVEADLDPRRSVAQLFGRPLAALPGALTLGLVVFALSLSGGVLVERVAAQGDAFSPVVDLLGFDTASVIEAYSGVDLVVKYVPRRNDLQACGVGSETHRIDDRGVSRRHGASAVLLARINVGDTTQSCVYTVVWPRVTGFSSPGAATLWVGSPIAHGPYRAPSVYLSEQRVVVEHSAALVADVEQRFGSSPPGVLGWRFSVSPTADSPNGCDANTKDLTETTWQGEIVPAARAGSKGSFAFTSSNPLILRPSGARSDCRYDVEFAAVGVDGQDLSTLYVRDPSFFDERLGPLGPGQLTVLVRYTTVGEVWPTGREFTPDVAFNVPWTDYDDNGRHDYADVEFRVWFNTKPGPRIEGCPTARTEFRYAIAPLPIRDGNQHLTAVSLAPGSPSTLPDVPSGKAYRCVYDVDYTKFDTFAGRSGVRREWWRYGRVDDPVPETDDFEVFGGDPSAEVTYGHANQYVYVAFEARAEAAAQGETVMVNVEPVSGSHSRCTTATKTITFDATGAGRETQRLADWPASHRQASDRCEYTVTWADSEAGGSTYPRVGPQTMTIDASVFAQDVPTLSNTYSSGPPAPLTPQVSIAVPPIDEDGDGQHDFAGDGFRVGFARNEQDDDANCTQSADARYDIEPDGSVSLVGALGADQTTVTPGFELVGWHPDSAGPCRYAVTFNANSDFTEDDAWPMRDAEISGNDPVARATYDTSRKAMTATFEVTGLGVPAGTPVTVAFRLVPGAPAACADTRTSAPGGWTQTSGVWRNTLEVDRVNAQSLRDLLVLPAGWRSRADERCDYEVIWPDDEDDGPNGEVRDAYPRLATAPPGALPLIEDGQTGDPPRDEVTYRAYFQRPVTHFVPEVDVSVPFDDDDGTGGNRFAGETITITYARVAGQVNELACTATATDTFTIGPGGSASAGGEVSRGAAPELVDEPAVERVGHPSRQCTYTASAAASTELAGGGAGGLSLVGGAQATLNADGVIDSGGQASGGPASFAYASAFTAEIDLTMPTDRRDKLGEDGFERGDSAFKGAEIPVTFTATNSSPPGCLPSPRTVEFVVSDDGTATITTGDLVLVERVGGETTPCSYTVEFAATVNEGSTTEAIDYTLNVDGPTAATISAASPAANRSYTLAQDIFVRRFTSPMQIRVPASQQGANANPYAGATFDVTYTLASGPAATCTSFAGPLVYEADSVGEVGIRASQTGLLADEVVLHHRQDPSDAPCVYQATLPATVSSPPGETPAWTLTLTDTTPVAIDIDTTGPAATRSYQERSTGSTSGANGGTRGTGATNPLAPSAPSGGGPRTPSTSGGGGGGGRTSGGGSSGDSSGGGATAPWVVATSRVPVAVSLQMPERDFSVGTAIEIMLNVPGTCGDDITAFAGLPANIGLVYALPARSGTTANVLAAGALRLAGYAERDGSTRDCEVRITLITAPSGCRLDGASTDQAGRSYVELTGGQSISSYAATPTLTCE